MSGQVISVQFHFQVEVHSSRVQVEASPAARQAGQQVRPAVQAGSQARQPEDKHEGSQKTDRHAQAMTRHDKSM